MNYNNEVRSRNITRPTETRAGALSPEQIARRDREQRTMSTARNRPVTNRPATPAPRIPRMTAAQPRRDMAQVDRANQRAMANRLASTQRLAPTTNGPSAALQRAWGGTPEMLQAAWQRYMANMGAA